MSSVMPDNLRAQQQYPGGDWRSGYQSLPVRRDGSSLPRATWWWRGWSWQGWACWPGITSDRTCAAT